MALELVIVCLFTLYLEHMFYNNTTSTMVFIEGAVVSSYGPTYIFISIQAGHYYKHKTRKTCLVFLIIHLYIYMHVYLHWGREERNSASKTNKCISQLPENMHDQVP